MKTFFAAVSAMLLSVTMAFAASPDRGNADDAMAMINKAYAYFQENGADALTAAAMDKEAGTFFDRDLYVIIFDYDGNNVAHGANPKLAGKNLNGVKDPNGLQIAPAMAAVAAKGEGWVDYHWTDPVSGMVALKTTYVKDLGNGTYMGVGIYK